MKNTMMTAVAGAAMMLITLGSGTAAPVASHLGSGPAIESGATQVQWGHCERLRWRCEHKNELGQEGMGNCQRYREECGGRDRYCEHLRRACEYKNERGEEGQGNCRRYRAECGGRY